MANPTDLLEAPTPSSSEEALRDPGGRLPAPPSAPRPRPRPFAFFFFFFPLYFPNFSSTKPRGAARSPPRSLGGRGRRIAPAPARQGRLTHRGEPPAATARSPPRSGSLGASARASGRSSACQTRQEGGYGTPLRSLRAPRRTFQPTVRAAPDKAVPQRLDKTCAAPGGAWPGRGRPRKRRRGGEERGPGSAEEVVRADAPCCGSVRAVWKCNGPERGTGRAHLIGVSPAEGLRVNF